ncbi:MAG: response regulator transcription factor [Thermoleophilaceae bacterium]
MGARAVIVEDHDAVSKGLELVLGKAGIDVVGSARTEEEGYEVIERERPSLAIVDLGLEHGSGVQLARRLSDAEWDLGVLIYTGLGDESLLRQALDSGARGFALKAAPANEVVAAARTVAAGGSYVDPRLNPYILGHAATDEIAVLSPREREVMALLAEGLNGPEIADRLFISPATVRTHVENAMQKLEARTRVHAIAIALRQGLLKIPDSPY